MGRSGLRWVGLGVQAGQELLEVPQRQLLRELLETKKNIKNSQQFIAVLKFPDLIL